MTQPFTFTIRVRANATNNKVGGTAGDPPRLVVAVQAPAVDGKANSAILKELAKAFGLRSRDFTIISGELSRDKRIQVIGDSEAISNRFSNLASKSNL